MSKLKFNIETESDSGVSGQYKNWFLDYASYVILERAVPAIEDGVKPVNRRILHAMKEMDDGRLNKAANIIGQTMQYHPHGDASIQDALVNLGQKDLLVETQGNWGDVRTGDDAAAPTMPSATATMTDEPTTTEEPTTPAEPVGTVEAPTAFVALRSADGMNLRWKAPMATEGLTGFNVELKPAGGDWAVVATTGPTELTHSVMLTSADSWTQFRVSSVYADGQTASAKIFGLAGQYK
jgi:hypothetical protein